MVAETPIYHLPYQQGSDKPCFGPGTGCDNLESVWCDFVTLVEAQLDSFDGIVGRTATAIPMAKITVEGNWISNTCGAIPFDTVVFDTDNMVDLNAGAGITPNRNGVYRIDFSIFFEDLPSPNGQAAGHIRVGTEAEPTVGATIPGSVATAHTINHGGVTAGGELRASTLYRFTSTLPSPRMVIGEVSCLIGIISINTPYIAALEMYWHGEA